MAEPLFLYRTQAQTILDLIAKAGDSGSDVDAVQAQLLAGVGNLTDPVRLLLEDWEAAGLERVLRQTLPPEQQLKDPWTTILTRVALLRGAIPARHWRSR